jgi:hypothetical protein
MFAMVVLLRVEASPDWAGGADEGVSRAGVSRGIGGGAEAM